MKVNETKKLGLCALNSKFFPNFLELNSAQTIGLPLIWLTTPHFKARFLNFLNVILFLPAKKN